jgi:hypothetical protein
MRQCNWAQIKQQSWDSYGCGPIAYSNIRAHSSYGEWLELFQPGLPTRVHFLIAFLPVVGQPNPDKAGAKQDFCATES